MDTTIGRRKPSQSLVEASSLLDTWTSHPWSQGISVDRLAALDRLIVTTRHSTYELIVLTPANAEVMVRGGAFFTEFTRARLSGSSLGGSFLKLRTVHVGFRMELADGDRSIVTSPVQEVSLVPAGSARTPIM